ncbi:LD-carboxypeptidase [Butyrivibrio sp. CB08]|uniref:S66 family peptidase n=1 Tax=Butyrivibrio sp. CB08 TaxID=2364879 RepID=UPI000EA899B0|nr:S66 peptidase family protein [Butyrivibrio sp. CB08]RKM62382.1 LD-carboxypeptidase [Butyrivibrio sp. CB08]
MIKRPDSIKSGNTIGITAPSYGASIEPYSLLIDISEDNIRNRGYKIVEGKTARLGDGIGISTDPKVCAAELMEFYKRDDIDAIISAGGGELMVETITHVDFDELKKYKPKWYLGYSDNTNFIFPLVTITGVQGIYGPCINGFAKVWEDTEKDSFAILEGTKSSFDGYNKFVEPVKEEQEVTPEYTDEYLRAPYAYNADRELVSFVPDKTGLVPAGDSTITMDGVLLGGCLDILDCLVGTRFDRVKEFNKNNPKVIWVLECCDLTPMSIRRGIWTLREAGWFENAAGFVFGRPREAWKQNMLGVDQYNAATDVLKDLGVPVVMDAEIGHIDPMLPVIMGAEATVTVKGNSLNISYNQ